MMNDSYCILNGRNVRATKSDIGVCFDDLLIIVMYLIFIVVFPTFSLIVLEKMYFSAEKTMHLEKSKFYAAILFC